MAKYIVRKPFAVHLAWFEDQDMGDGKTRKIRREQSYFHGPSPVELSNADAMLHMHKLEPVDAAAKALFQDYHDKQEEARDSRQARDGNTKTMAAQIAEAVVGALIAAGILKAKGGKSTEAEA